MADLFDFILSESFMVFCKKFRDVAVGVNYLDTFSCLHNNLDGLVSIAKDYLFLGRVVGSPADQLKFIAEERLRQIEKFGNQANHSDEDWLHILLEEIGEVSRQHCEIMFLAKKTYPIGSIEAMKQMEEIEMSRARIRTESVQVAAVACAWFQARKKLWTSDQ